jgi:hypothetical protein
MNKAIFFLIDTILLKDKSPQQEVLWIIGKHTTKGKVIKTP